MSISLTQGERKKRETYVNEVNSDSGRTGHHLNFLPGKGNRKDFSFAGIHSKNDFLKTNCFCNTAQYEINYFSTRRRGDHEASIVENTKSLHNYE